MIIDGVLPIEKIVWLVIGIPGGIITPVDFAIHLVKKVQIVHKFVKHITTFTLQ